MALLKVGAKKMLKRAERRCAIRQRVYLAAEVVDVMQGGAQPLECAVRSISSNGANLRVSSSAPPVFDLRLVRDGASRRARTVWAYGDKRGVVFENAVEGAAQKRSSIIELRRAFRVVETPSDG
jgi:hypothetical protein